ncbi:MAG: glycerol-3-phosphate 1-O-acyltransferase PlsY [Lachnospiraceae bacterium]|nr:glycerol-3-phosphate 1-O-acyltransferase PlsY [Lachnospiraceae bacterium]
MIKMIVARGISLLIGYVFGMFLSGFFIGKSKDVDIRTQGSGNVGTTNTMRILGIRVGAITLLLDSMKCILALLVVWALFHTRQPEHLRLLMLYGALGAILGHDFPVFMKFKGGKGIATSFGMLIVLYPQFLPVCVLLFAIAVGLTRYVSLGSILAAMAVIVQVIVFGRMGLLSYADTDLLEAQIITVGIGLLAIYLHKSNIKRLLAGNENKLSFKSKRD